MKNKILISLEKFNYLNYLAYFTILLIFWFYYLDIARAYQFPINDELGYLDEGIHLRNVSYDFREIYNRNRTPFLPLIISFISLNKSNLNPFLVDSSYSMEYMILFRNSQIAIIIITLFLTFLIAKQLEKFFKSKVTVIFYIFYLLYIPVTLHIKEVLIEPIFMLLYLYFILILFEVKDSSATKDFVKFGIISGVLFLSKYTGFIIFVFTWLTLLTYRYFYKKEIKINISIKQLMISFFILCMIGSPYIIANISDGLNPFYSVNSKILWYSSWPEAYQIIDQYDGNHGFKNIPEDLKPGISYYINNNTLSDTLDRIKLGVGNLKNDYSNPFDLAGKTSILLFCLIILITFNIIFTSRNEVINIIKKNIYEILFIMAISLSLIAGYILYSPISNSPRFHLYITLPIVFLFSFFLDRFSFLECKKIYIRNILNLTSVFLFTYINLIFINTYLFYARVIGFVKSLF